MVENRAAAVVEDDLSRAFGLKQRFDEMRGKDSDLVLSESTQFSLSIGWPIVNFTHRRFVLIHAQEGLAQKYKGSCHAELITAWATSDKNLPALTKRCEL